MSHSAANPAGYRRWPLTPFLLLLGMGLYFSPVVDGDSLQMTVFLMIIGYVTMCWRYGRGWRCSGHPMEMIGWLLLAPFLPWLCFLLADWIL